MTDLARDLALALDPARFMGACGPTPDPWQTDVLRSGARQALLLCCRQSGKSTVTAALATHTALFQPGSLVLLFAPGLRQSQELFRKVMNFYRQVGTLDPDAESAQRLELPNGSRIVSLPGNHEAVRGYSAPALVILDEAAWVEDELYFAVRPMLATSGGRLVAMTTPWGRRGWFHRAWTAGGTAWDRVKVSAYDCPRITPVFLAEERAAMPEHRFRSEYLCEFVDTDEQLFPTDLIRAAVSTDIAPLPAISW